MAHVVAADGTRSPVRRTLGITEDAGPVFGESVNVCFRSAALTRSMADSPHMTHWVVDAELSGAVYITGRDDRWILNVERDPALPDSAYDDARRVDMVRRAVGDPDLDVEVLTTLRWLHESAVADTWRVGRVLLAGDAVRRFPPHGGFGMNSGIQDTHNLVWKLVRVLRGDASDGLLDTYEQERKPVAVHNRDQVMLNTERLAETGWLADAAEEIAGIELPEGEAIRRRIRDGVPAQREQFWTSGQQFGYLCTSSAVIADGTAPEVSTVSDYRPTGHPGARAPHLWLRDRQDRRCSTVDLPAAGFVLLTGAEGEPWREPADRLGIRRVVIGRDLVPERVDLHRHPPRGDRPEPGPRARRLPRAVRHRAEGSRSGQAGWPHHPAQPGWGDRTRTLVDAWNRVRR
ncbi:FAD-dependent monooxygenase [Streptomyces sp. NPDC048290]|uniref:FAD-dependent monooxygenase n=1 Tax=Streptomyces sp. NPDC048290 TaxID=3155811 RepID=UPI003413C515